MDLGNPLLGVKLKELSMVEHHPVTLSGEKGAEGLVDCRIVNFMERLIEII